MSKDKTPALGPIVMKSNRLASGKTLFKGKTYRVPEDVSEQDATYLLACKHAVKVEPKGKGKAAEGDK